MEWIEKVKIVDVQSEKSKVGVGVLVTCHHGQRAFLEACLESVKDLGWVTLVYDNPGGNYFKYFPNDKCLSLVENFIVKHETRIMPGPTFPQFWNFSTGAKLIDTPLVFVIGADSVLEHPENMGDIVEMLGDGDIIACSTHNPQRHGNTPFCGTKSFLVKNHIFKMLMKKVEETFIPFDHKYGNMENRFGWGIKELGLKEVVAPELPGEDQFSYGPWTEDGNVLNRGTWGSVLGFRHLRGEMVRRQIELQRPVEAKYFDQQYCSSQEKEVLKYWDEMDELKKKEILVKWWSYNPIAKKALEERDKTNIVKENENEQNNQK